MCVKLVLSAFDAQLGIVAHNVVGMSNYCIRYAYKTFISTLYLKYIFLWQSDGLKVDAAA